MLMPESSWFNWWVVVIVMFVILVLGDGRGGMVAPPLLPLHLRSFVVLYNQLRPSK